MTGTNALLETLEFAPCGNQPWKRENSPFTNRATPVAADRTRQKLLHPITGRLGEKLSQVNSLSTHQQFSPRFEVRRKRLHPRQ